MGRILNCLWWKLYNRGDTEKTLVESEDAEKICVEAECTAILDNNWINIIMQFSNYCGRITVHWLYCNIVRFWSMFWSWYVVVYINNYVLVLDFTRNTTILLVLTRCYLYIPPHTMIKTYFKSKQCYNINNELLLYHNNC